MIDAPGHLLRTSSWRAALLGVAVVVLGCDPMPNWPDIKHGTYLRIEPDSLTLAEGRMGALRTRSDGEFVWGIHWSIIEDWSVVSLVDVSGTSNSVTALAPGVRHVTVDAVRNKDQVVLMDTATVVVLPVTPRTLAISPDSLLIAANPLASWKLHGVLRDSVGVVIQGRWRSWSWTSSDTSIAMVTLWGDPDQALVYGMRVGQVVVTARMGQLADSALVIVRSTR